MQESQKEEAGFNFSTVLMIMISHLNFDNWQNWPLYSKIAEIKALFNNITQVDFKWVFFTIFFMLIFLSDREPCC